MLAPNAEQIETAQDQLLTLSDFIRNSQRKELHAAMGTESDDVVRGYELGLQTARVVIAQSMAIILGKVKPEDVL